MPAMHDNLPFYIGLRFMRAKRRNSFISFVSLFAFAGMALGVFALIVVLSVMNGFDRELKQRILRVVPHGYISSQSPLQDWRGLQQRIIGAPGLEGSAPYIQGHGLVTYAGSVHGIEFQGIEPAYEPQVSEVGDYMLIGHLERLQPGEYGIVLGSLLARYLGVTTGDKLTITLPKVAITPAGIFPRRKRFTVVGVFEVGAQVDQNLALMHIADAQTLLRMKGEVDGLRLKFDSIYHAPGRVAALQQQLGPDYVGRDWSQTQGNLFQAVKMEKTVVGVMLGIIVAVAAFNIITTLIMMIAEKRSEIAVLRTMGMPARGVLAIFMVQGIAIGLVGIALGAVFGVLVASNMGRIVAFFESVSGAQVFDPTVYFVTTMPSHLMFSDVLWVCLGATVISLLATSYPAYRATRIQPADALRYNI